MSGSLGTFSFIQLDHVNGNDCAPDTLGEMSDVLQRAGVNGSGIRVAGVKGKEFQMRSGVDITDAGASPDLAMQAAAQLMNSYKALQGGAPQQLVWRTQDYDNLGVRFVVLMVTPREIFPVHNMSGGTAGTATYGAYVRAQWTLIPVTF